MHHFSVYKIGFLCYTYKSGSNIKGFFYLEIPLMRVMFESIATLIAGYSRRNDVMKVMIGMKRTLSVLLAVT